MFGALLLGYPLLDTGRFKDMEVDPAWAVQPALQLQLLRQTESSGALVMQLTFQGGPARFDGVIPYIAVPMRTHIEAGWRLQMQKGGVQWRWEGGTGLYLATLGFPSGIWEDWVHWGLGAYTAPSLSFGKGAFRPVASLYLDVVLIPTVITGGLSVRTDPQWRWGLSSVGASLLVGVEWGGQPADE